MKKSTILIAAALLLGMTACQKEDVQPIIVNGDNIPQMGDENYPLVKTTADLRGTDWAYTFDFATLADPNCPIPAGMDLTVEFGLTFDQDSAHFTFPQEVVAFDMLEVNGEYTMQQVNGKNFGYSYDGGTHTGDLLTADVDENGAPVTYNIPFTYTDSTDVITVNLMSIDENNDTTVFPLPFVRVNATTNE